MNLIQASIVLVLTVTVAGIAWAGWKRARSNRIARLTAVATSPDAGTLARLERAVEPPALDRSGGSSEEGLLRAALEGGAVAALAIPAEALWTLAQIDSNVVAAVSQASARALDGSPEVPSTILGFLDYVAENADKMDNPGFMSRLQGYVVEQDAADRLESSGLDVEWASTANQAGWDFVVDGAEVNVKSVADVSQVLESARLNPDITYILNEDVAGGSDLPNVEVLEGVSRAEAIKRLHGSMEAGADLVDGTFVLGGLDGPIPVTLLAVIVMKEVRNYRKGVKSREEAVTDGVVGAVFQGTGVTAGVAAGGWLGAQAGAAVDGLAGGFTGGAAAVSFAIVGGVAGGALGSAAGKRAQMGVKFGPHLRAQRDLEEALRAYGQRCRAEGAVERLSNVIQGPSRRAHEALAVLDQESARARQTWRWRVWPSETQVLVVSTGQRARERVDLIDDEIRHLQERLRAISTGEHSDEAVGLMFTNSSALRDTCDGELPELDDVRLAFLRARRRRAALAHPLSKSEQAQALKLMLGRKSPSPLDD